MVDLNKYQWLNLGYGLANDQYFFPPNFSEFGFGRLSYK
jgi:hypothetical protein